MSIGQHRIGKIFTNFRTSVVNRWDGILSNKLKVVSNVIPYNVNGITSASLPYAPVNPYRKRPVKLMYDRNEYHMFKLPSEKAFLLGGMDTQDIFGARKGIQHSPHLRAQMDMDSNLVWCFAIASFVLLVIENKRSHDFVTLRENENNSDKGWFRVEDFN
jgi:hypothetical protein